MSKDDEGQFREEQIIGILKHYQAGRRVANLACGHAISEATIYTWKSKYGGLEMSEAQPLKASGGGELAAKTLGGQPQPGQGGVEGSRAKKRLELSGLRGDASAIQQHETTERRGCKPVGPDRSSYRYEPRSDHNATLRGELVSLARQKPRQGSRRLHALVTKRGQALSSQRVYRIYQGERLAVRRLKRTRLSRPAALLPYLHRANQKWALAIASDGLGTGRGICVLAIVNAFTRECLALEVDTVLSVPARDAHAGMHYGASRRSR